jgi:hypothetical protein
VTLEQEKILLNFVPITFHGFERRRKIASINVGLATIAARQRRLETLENDIFEKIN